MRKPIYQYPCFVIEAADKRSEKENKRLWLKLTIDKNRDDSIVVILKNPSRATKDISDKTVSNVTKYIYKNKDNYESLKNIGTIIILNLIPFYETYSHELKNVKIDIVDIENLKTIREITSKHKNVVIAWGDPPRGLQKQYENLKHSVMDILKENKTNLYHVDKLSKKGNPKHGQVWSHKNTLIKYELTK